MPRAKGNKPPRRKVDVNDNRPYYCPSEADWGGYVNLRLNESERGDFDDWSVETRVDFQTTVDRMLVDGLKLSVSYDAENSCYIASFTGGGCLGDNARYALVARGETFTEAVALAVYKHVVLLDGDWSSYMPSTGRSKFG